MTKKKDKRPFVTAEYLWLGGQGETRVKPREIRAPKKLGLIADMDDPGALEVPRWSFDGSSTGQANGDKSDCILVPVHTFPDPVRGAPHIIVLCEVFTVDGQPHESNTRAIFRKVYNANTAQKPWLGYEAEFTYLRNDANTTPLGFPETGDDPTIQQGPYYCSVGAENAYGQEIFEETYAACKAANLQLYGGNSEVMPGQWELQCGPRSADDDGDALRITDHMVVMRYLIKRIAQKYGVIASFHPKPKEKWNGAGCHTNVSTEVMRSVGGLQHLRVIIESFQVNWKHCLTLFGENNEKRLSGKYETCDMYTFKAGVYDRTASIRIPPQTAKDGKGYIEIRSVAASADYYLVASVVITSACGLVFTMPKLPNNYPLQKLEREIKFEPVPF